MPIPMYSTNFQAPFALPKSFTAPPPHRTHPSHTALRKDKNSSHCLDSTRRNRRNSQDSRVKSQRSLITLRLRSWPMSLWELPSLRCGNPCSLAWIWGQHRERARWIGEFSLSSVLSCTYNLHMLVLFFNFFFFRPFIRLSERCISAALWGMNNTAEWLGVETCSGVGRLRISLDYKERYSRLPSYTQVIRTFAVSHTCTHARAHNFH